MRWLQVRNIVYSTAICILAVIAAGLACKEKKQADHIKSPFGAIRIYVRDTNPAARYVFGVGLHRYDGNEGVGWPSEVHILRYSFDDTTLALDSLQPGLYDVWLKAFADIDGDGFDDAIWAPSLVEKVRLGPDSVTYVDVHVSGQSPNPGLWPMECPEVPVFTKWGGKIVPR